MRRKTQMIATVATIAAGSLAGTASAQAYTIGFGPGPLGTGSIEQTTTEGTDGYLNLGAGVTYQAPTSVTGCPMYCATTFYLSGGLWKGQQTGDGIALEGQTASPLPYHAFDAQDSTLGGPYLSYN
jgi:hypothetical protein